MPIKLLPPRSKIQLLFGLYVLALFVGVLGMSLTLQSASAEPPQPQSQATQDKRSADNRNATTISELQKSCKDYLKNDSKKFKGDVNKACSKGKMERLLNAASNACDFRDGQGYECIQTRGTGFIKDAEREMKRNGNQNDFNSELNKIYDSKNLNPNKINPAAGASLDPQQSGGGGAVADPAIECDGDRCDFIAKYVNPAIAMLSVVFGLIVIASLIMGGIQYSASQGDPQKVTQAKQRIGNTILAFVVYIFLYAFLQFLVPGGIFR
jgi:hypothetical protein